MSTCRGCALFLCGECRQPEPLCGACRGEGHPIPWEDPSLGRLQAFGRTLLRLIRPDFFDHAPWTGGLRRPLAFAVICATLGALGGWCFALLSLLVFDPQATLAGALAGTPLQNDPQVTQLLGQLAELQRSWVVNQWALVALTPLITLLEVVVLGALTHAVARGLGGQGSFEGTLRVTAYAGAAQLLAAVPGAGGLVTGILRIVLMGVGLRRAHGLSVGRAAVAATWWIPVAFVFALLVVALVLRAIVAAW